MQKILGSTIKSYQAICYRFLSHLLKIYRNFPTGFVSTSKLNFGVSIDIFALFCIIKI